MNLQVRVGDSERYTTQDDFSREKGLRIVDIEDKDVTEFMKIFCGLWSRNFSQPTFTMKDMVAFLDSLGPTPK